MAESRVLVAGASGQLGKVIARKLVAAGVPVRALARSREKLLELEAEGAEIAPVDMGDVRALTEACRGVGQVVATANNNMGSGPTSPTRVDLPAYQNLCAAIRNTGVRRLVYVSFRGVDSDAPVDIFRVKWYIEDAIRRSGVSHVLLRPSAFIDVWVDQLMADEIRKKGRVTIFGSGTRVANYIAVEDVAEFAVRILAREEIVNEAIAIGGPSDVSQNDIATLLERRLGSSGKRRHLPVVALKILPVLVRPFNEVGARLITLGLYNATLTTPFPSWTQAATRFGVTPRTIEAHIEALPRSQ
jgi:uncharacterized protein YbjT (DUF2867 family)